MTTRASLSHLIRKLAHDLDTLEWSTPSHVYNPMQYAWDGYEQLLERFGEQRGRVLLVGMNPGPWGMAQTGIPFGNVSTVRDWLHIETKLSSYLPKQHPKYPILGMNCCREEGSGKRLWGWVNERVGAAELFFERFFVWNYCPLLFLGKDHNLVPSALRVHEQQPMEERCSTALKGILRLLEPAAIIAIGRYAELQVKRVVDERLPIRYLLHPSPANPAANHNWRNLAEDALGPWLPSKHKVQKNLP